MKINKSDKGASGWRKHLRFHFHRGRGHLPAYLWNRVRWHIYPRLNLAGRLPDHVDLELSSVCNMACPMCYTTTRAFKERVPRRQMAYSLYRRIIDQLAAHGVFSIRLSWRGEPLLNGRFIDCVRYAREKGIPEISSLTNALLLSSRQFEELVDLKMDWLTISFDGSGKTYEKIRHPAKFDVMAARIAAFARIKKRKNSAKPVLRIQAVWPAVARDPDAFFNLFAPLADEISINSLLDYRHQDKKIEYISPFTCPVPFQRLAIGSDGRAFMCINDELGRVTVGDANSDPIARIWRGPALQRVREFHKKNQGLDRLAPCRDCYQPRKTVVVPRRVGDRVIYLEELEGRGREPDLG